MGWRVYSLMGYNSESLGKAGNFFTKILKMGFYVSALNQTGAIS
jgi:hypothetical protein